MTLLSKFKSARYMMQRARLVQKGFATLNKTKRTPEEAYYAMRELFVLTNGRSNDAISRLLKKPGYKNIPISGVLGLNNRRDLLNVVSNIEANGFHIFEKELPEKIVSDIYNYALKTPCSYLKSDGKSTGYSEDLVLFNETQPISPRYEFSPNQILSCPQLQSLIFDTSILAVAQEYLGTKPILDLIAMWWSAPFKGVAKSEAAQLYHFDLDRIKFLKFFFYITDVDTNTGPHCYVRGSHKRLPRQLLKEGRLQDAEVEDAFGKENMLELGGQKGKILAVDTRGLHKGKDLISGKRLLFQIEFANSMFGQFYQPAHKPVLPDDLEKQSQTYKETYQEIMA